MKYRTIVADPPWPYERGLPRWTANGVDNSDNLPYRTMSLEDLASLPVGDLSDERTHLYLWTTSRFLEQAFGLLRSWEFSLSQVLVWCKPPRGFSGRATFSPVSEFVLFAHRGPLEAKRAVYQNWFNWPRGSHSSKPDAFYDLVESVSHAPYLELFARRARFGWDYWGDESLSTVEIATTST